MKSFICVGKTYSDEMEMSLLFCTLVSLVATWATTRKWIRIAQEAEITGLDMNKPEQQKVSEMGGVCVVFGFTLGILAYIGLHTIYQPASTHTPIFAALCTVFMACFIGVVDDILGWKSGLKQWHKLLLTIFVAIPIVVINVNQTTMNLPFVGCTNCGILYPLLIVPIGIIGASNAYNMLAGYNGLEAGMGVIILSTLGYIGTANGRTNAVALAVIMTGSLMAFLYFNWYPARIFPGDTMTYSVGALISCVAILGGMEMIAVILFLPYAIDFILPLRMRFDVEAFAKVNEDGSLDQPYDKIYDITHLAIAALNRLNGKVYEKDVVVFIYAIEVVISIVVLLSGGYLE